MPLSVVESRVRSRGGAAETSSDVVLVTPNLVALLSGVGTSSGSALLPAGVTPARHAAMVGAAAFRALDPQMPLHEALPQLSAELARALARVAKDGYPLRAGYAFAAVNSVRREVWRVGAVQVMRDGLASGEETGLPPALGMVAAARTLILQALLTRSSDDFNKAVLMANDPSQPLIAPLLAAYAGLANSQGSLGYGLVNGSEVPACYLKVGRLLPGAREIVLASQGYPQPCATLAASEKALTKLLQDDPLLIERYPFIRSARQGQDGYADRAYVRVRMY